MATFNKHSQFVEDLCKKVHNFSTDTLKILLTNTAPTPTNSIKSDLTEISAGNGYSAGGTALSVTTSSQSSGTFTFAASTIVFTASGGTIGPFRYVDLYNDTPSSPLKPLVGWWDYGSSITLNNGETFTVQFNSTNPGTVFTLA